MRSNKKGTTLLVEQTFVMVFGIIILVTVLTVFSTLKHDTTEFVSENQYESVASYVGNAIMQAFKDMKYSYYGTIYLELPSTIGNQPYYVYLNNTTLLVKNRQGSASREIELYNLEMELRGTLYSGARLRMINYNLSGNYIELEGAFPGLPINETAPTPPDVDTAPTLSWVNVTPDNPTTNQDLNCSFFATDEENATFHANVTWYMNGTNDNSWDENDKSITNNSMAYVNTAPTSSDTTPNDVWNCEVTVWDNAGSDSQNGSETIQAAPVGNKPTIYVMNGTNISTADNTPIMEMNFTDPENSTAQVTLYFNETNVSYNNSAQNNTVTNLTITSSQSDGIYNYWYYAADGADTNVSENRTIIIDTEKPNISYSSNSDTNATVPRSWIFINVTVSDSFYIDNVTLEWNSVNESFDNMQRIADGTYYYWENKTSLSNGVYYFKAYANDSAGNENKTRQRNVNVSAIAGGTGTKTLVAENQDSTATAYSSQRKVVRDSLNLIHVIYTNDSNTFHKSSDDDGTTWSTEHDVSDPENNALNCTLPSLGVRSNDSLVVVCEDTLGTYLSHDRGETWNQKAAADMYDIPSLYVHLDDFLHVVGGDDALNYHIIYKRSTDFGLTWSGAAEVSDNCVILGTRMCNSPIIVQDLSMMLYVVWNKEISAADHDVYWSYCNATVLDCTRTENWAAEAALWDTPLANEPESMVVTNDNIVHLVMTDYNDIYYVNNSGGSWNTPVLISGIENDADTEASISTNGTDLYVFFEVNTNNYTLWTVNSTDGGESWGTPDSLTSTLDGDDHYVSAIYDYSTNPIDFIWTETQEDTTYDVYYNNLTATEGGGGPKP